MSKHLRAKVSAGHPHSQGDEPTWFERPKNINRLIVMLVVSCVILVAIDLVYANPHPHFAIESTVGFQAWFGFAAFVVIVFLGRFLRLFVRREEGYYDR